MKRTIVFYVNGSYAEILVEISKTLNREFHLIAFCQNQNAYNICKESNSFESIEYLYEDFNYYFDLNKNNKIPDQINFFEVLMTDKSHYKKESNFYQERIISNMYFIFQKWLHKFKIDYIFFPIIESIDAMILYKLTLINRIKPICYAHGRHINKSFFSDSHTETLPVYYKSLRIECNNYDKSKEILELYLKNQNTLDYSKQISENIISRKSKIKSNLIKRVIKNIIYQCYVKLN